MYQWSLGRMSLLPLTLQDLGIFVPKDMCFSGEHEETSIFFGSLVYPNSQYIGSLLLDQGRIMQLMPTGIPHPPINQKRRKLEQLTRLDALASMPWHRWVCCKFVPICQDMLMF